MAFSIFVNSTTADASDVNDNFYHIAQGSRLPLGGSSLEPTDSVYNIGSELYKWETLYANNIICENISVSTITSAGNSLFVKLVDYELSSTTQRIDFTGLDGDTEKEYIIYYKIKFTVASGGATNLRVSFNQDSATNYGYQYIRVLTTTVSGLNSPSVSNIIIGSVNGDLERITTGRLHVIAKSGEVRSFYCDSGSYIGDNRISDVRITSGVWNNTSDNLTSIQLFTDSLNMSISSGSLVSLWAIK